MKMTADDSLREARAARREDQIERVLERIEAGTFARCETCGENIEAARLIAVPYTTRCRDCAQDE